ncbi:hypothetical protein O3M35_005479 [Rhynocoris fuscipes]|uniref:15-cis-phytoene synthase n=1 Tax=Rhynocoris fuscipes TaxID=488301 RepID=A0AAW1DQH1_9HEMI
MARFTKIIFSPYFLCVRNKSSTSRSSPAEYCANLVKTHDYENFLCTLLLSKAARSAAFAIRAFNIEIARIADQTNESTIAAMRMKFWEETLDKMYNDKTPNHPVAKELARIVQKHGLLKRQLTRLIGARFSVLNDLTFENMEVMEKYAEESVSPVYYLILQASGIKNIHADHAASHLGKAQGLTNLLRALPHNLNKRQLLLPQDVLLKHSVSQEDIIRKNLTEGVKQVIFDVASSANLHLKMARSLKKNVPKEAFTIFLPAVPVATFLENLSNSDFDIFTPFIHQRNVHLGFTLFLRKLLSSY